MSSREIKDYIVTSEKTEEYGRIFALTNGTIQDPGLPMDDCVMVYQSIIEDGIVRVTSENGVVDFTGMNPEVLSEIKTTQILILLNPSNPNEFMTARNADNFINPED